MKARGKSREDRPITEKLEGISLHPFLVALYPVVAYLANNVDQVRISEALRPAVASLVIAAAFYGFLRILGTKSRRAGVLTSLTLLLFFSYGHLYEALKASGVIDPIWVRHRYLVPLALGLLFSGYWFLLRQHAFGGANLWLNAFAIVAFIVPTSQVAWFAASGQLDLQSGRTELTCENSSAPTSARPDVYLIVLDAYTRADILRELHGFDNREFLMELEERGFYIADGSLSNYRHTEMSLASLLNMNYVQEIPGSYKPESQNRMGLVRLIQESKVRREFECRGYDIVAFETGVFWTEWEDADHFISREAGLLDRLRLFGGLSRFEAGLLESTAVRVVEDVLAQLEMTGDAERIARGPDQDLRDRVLFLFESMDEVARLDGPKFVFAHVLSPHPPFVFGRSGEPVGIGRFEDSAPDRTEEELLQAYVDQVIYLNGRVIEAVDQILAHSSTPPIIVIMGDHGWAERNAEDKISILNAYRFPEGGKDVLYPTITPVNTFRAMFDSYFGTDFGLLPDVSYFSTEDDVYDFSIVENSWPE